MKLALLRAAAAALVIGLATSAVDAQERKKSSERQRSQERESSSTYTGGMPSCAGGMVIIQDGSSAQCRHPDGRICTVRSGTSGYATVSDCK